MKRNDLKEISENEFVAVLGMMRLESFLDGYERYEIGQEFDEYKRYNPKIKKEGIYDVIGAFEPLIIRFLNGCVCFSIINLSIQYNY